MLALAVTITFVVVLLGVLVVGLLRSHADILRALHDLGAGVGDPASAPARGSTAAGVPVPITMGPTLPAQRSSSSAHDVTGVSPGGDAVAVAVVGVAHRTLLAFLSSGCTTCQHFWRALAEGGARTLGADVRLVVVTKGADLEIPSEVAAKGCTGVPVVMSSEAWSDYEVPGSPFFVLVDGPAGRRIGEGVANHLDQVADLVRRAMGDAQWAPATGGPMPAGAQVPRLDGSARESANDAELIRHGILPGDPSLYPRSLEDVFRGAPMSQPGARRTG